MPRSQPTQSAVLIAVWRSNLHGRRAFRSKRPCRVVQAKATKGISNSDKSRLLALRVVQQATELKLTPFAQQSRSRSRSRDRERRRSRDRRRSRSRSRDGKRRRDRSSRSRSRSRGRDKERKGSRSRSSHKSSKHRRSRPSRSRSAERVKVDHEGPTDSAGGKQRPAFTEDVPKPKEPSPSLAGLPAVVSSQDEASNEASDDGDGGAWWDN